MNVIIIEAAWFTAIIVAAISFGGACVWAIMEGCKNGK